MAGLNSYALRRVLAELLDTVEERGSRMITRRLPENERGQAAQISMHIGGGTLGLRPKEVTWAMDMPVSQAESDLASLRNQVSDALAPTRHSGHEMPTGSLRHALLEKRRLLEEAQSAQSYSDYKTNGRRYAPAAF